MAKESIPNMSIAEFKAYFADKHTPKDLADAFAIADNTFWFIEDNEYDYKEGSPEHKAACDITDEWRALADEYQARIFEILKGEGAVIPAAGQITVLEPFMARFGYANRGGWWAKDN